MRVRECNQFLSPCHIQRDVRWPDLFALVSTYACILCLHNLFSFSLVWTSFKVVCQPHLKWRWLWQWSKCFWMNIWICYLLFNLTFKQESKNTLPMFNGLDVQLTPMHLPSLVNEGLIILVFRDQIHINRTTIEWCIIKATKNLTCVFGPHK